MDIGTIIVWLIALFMSLIGISTVQEAPSGEQASPTVESLVLIDKVEVLTLESDPYQLELSVSGQHPDGCDLPVQVEQRREGNTVLVKIYRELDPTLICPMMLVPYNATIRLEGGFESGAYRIDVNGTIVEIKL